MNKELDDLYSEIIPEKIRSFSYIVRGDEGAERVEEGLFPPVFVRRVPHLFFFYPCKLLR